MHKITGIKKLLSDRIIIEPMNAENKTASGIILHSGKKEAEGKGKVIQVSELCDQVNEGDTVMYPKLAGHDFSYNGREYRMLRQTEISLIINNNRKYEFRKLSSR